MTQNIKNLFWIQIKNKDKRAFGVFYDTYYPKLYSRTNRFIDDFEDCKDVVQETFIDFWKKVDQINPEKIFMEAYIWKILRNKIADYYKRKKDNKFYVDDYLEYIATETSSQEFEFDGDTSDRIEKAVNTLTGKAKEALIMSRRMGMTYKEIAIEMKISQKTVEYHISNAFHALRKELKDLF
ncbi:MAG: RNA polymerase sigma factor [Lutibacter sp.]